MKTLIAGFDPVQADTLGAKLRGLRAKDLPFLGLAEKADLGTTNIADPKRAEYFLDSRRG